MAVNKTSLKTMYEGYVHRLRLSLRPDQAEEAMELAVGGKFQLIGSIELSILRHYGLNACHSLVDVGCGSGRLAIPLSKYLKGQYLGIDIVADLVEYARKGATGPGWRFEVIDHIEIPMEDESADCVCFFSVLTHLMHEQSYWYLEEAVRVLKPGGRVVFSFLEFKERKHWPVFLATLANTKSGADVPMNVFIEKEAIVVWADHLGLSMIDVRGAADVIAKEGALGQSICVLEKPGRIKKNLR